MKKEPMKEFVYSCTVYDDLGHVVTGDISEIQANNIMESHNEAINRLFSEEGLN